MCVVWGIGVAGSIKVCVAGSIRVLFLLCVFFVFFFGGGVDVEGSIKVCAVQGK